jgi:hypothetical protein
MKECKNCGFNNGTAECEFCFTCTRHWSALRGNTDLGDFWVSKDSKEAIEYQKELQRRREIWDCAYCKHVKELYGNIITCDEECSLNKYCNVPARNKWEHR